MPIKVLLVEDHSLIRKAIRAILQEAPDIHLVGEATDGEEGVRLARELRPDIVLMDLKLPHLSGIEATRAITAEEEPPPVIILSVYEDDAYVSQAMQAGAMAYLLKDITVENLLRAIRAVHAGKAATSSATVRQLVEQLAQARNGGGAMARLHSDGLTDREVEILIEVAMGASNREIATKLLVSESTVKSHLRTIYRKVGVDDRAQAVAYAMRKGFVR